MKRIVTFLFILMMMPASLVFAQNNTQDMVDYIVQEATENSQLENLAHQLTDVIGPRLVGTPQMQHAHDWAVEQFGEWGISAENQQFGEWRGWERGITHVDLVSPRVVSLEGQQLAWSPATPEGGVTAQLDIIPEVENQAEFEAWLETIDGKIILVSQPQITGRPDYNWEEFATEESFNKCVKNEANLARNGAIIWSEPATCVSSIKHLKKPVPLVYFNPVGQMDLV